VIDGTANEFPFFSFLLADLHAHLLVTPFALVAVAYAVQLTVYGPPALERRNGPRIGAELALAALVIGGLYATNSFDYPTACILVAGGLLVWAFAEPGRWRRALLWGAATLVGSFCLFVPFWIAFSPPPEGIGVVREHVPFSRFAADYASIYGLALWALTALFASRARVPARYVVWSASVLLFVLVLLAPRRLTGEAVALLLAAAAVYVALGTGALSQPYRAVWLLTAVALGLAAGGEVVYLRDAFDGTESFRFNTVFKAGYQAWFLLAIVAGLVVYWTANWLGRRVRIAWFAGLAVLVALSLAYPLFASYSRSERFGNDPTLDGMRWLERDAPDDAAAIAWFRESVDGVPTVAETVGADFDPEGRARVSTFTGLPAVLGWAGHEVQWGHDLGTRIADVQELYRTTNERRARALLDRYEVDYVFVGDLERRDYPENGLEKFARLGHEAFRSGRTVVYDVSRSPSR
jgi:YYY domain-containing protein